MACYLSTIASAVATALAVCGLGYYLLCIWSARVFLHDWSRAQAQARNCTPPVSILKPLRGTDPGMYGAFRSHCLQDYPDYELVFGVADSDDPAIALVEQLRHEFPERRIQLLLCPAALGTNLKVSNLVQMLPYARHDYLLINDSDILVPPDYLRQVIAPFADPQVGMVTSLYRAATSNRLVSRLEALGISTDFSAGVLAARQLEGIHFALGSTLALPRWALNAIGGFEPLLDYLADDFELGARVAGAGYKVVLSNAVVETHVPDYTLRGYWNHQLRWARSMRDSRRWGYLGVVLTFGLPWALVVLTLAPRAKWAWTLLAVTAAVRFVVALFVGRWIVRDPKVPGDLWLLPLRDVLGLVIWAASYAGHTIAWRGDQFILENGRLRSAGLANRSTSRQVTGHKQRAASGRQRTRSR
jgi:ceramide glucosyltransferase